MPEFTLGGPKAFFKGISSSSAQSKARPCPNRTDAAILKTDTECGFNLNRDFWLIPPNAAWISWSGYTRMNKAGEL
jgi:hypothetical protein